MPDTINAEPPYLTKQGTILFDRRNGEDRRKMALREALQEAVPVLME